MKQCVFIFWVIVCCGCGSDTIKVSGKWINTEIRTPDDIGSISLSDDEVIITTADGITRPPIRIEPGSEVRFKYVNNDKLETYVFNELDPSENSLTFTVHHSNETDTVKFLNYSNFDTSVLKLDVEQMLTSKLWKDSTLNSTFQFRPNGVMVMGEQIDNETSYNFFEWQIFHFDSLYFLHLISIDNEVFEIRPLSQERFNLWSFNKRTLIRFNATPINSEFIDKASSNITGQWSLISDPNELPPPKYKSINFERIYPLNVFDAVTTTGEVMMGEWGFDFTGHLIFLSITARQTEEIMEIKPALDTPVFCLRGYCSQYKRIRKSGQ